MKIKDPDKKKTETEKKARGYGDAALTWVDDSSLLEGKVNDLKKRMFASRSFDYATARNYYDRPIIDTDIAAQPFAEYFASKDALVPGDNVTQEVCDASVAQICVPLHAKVEPVDADWETQQACEQLQLIIDGVFDVTNFLEKATRGYKDSTHISLGWLRATVNEQEGEIKCDRVNPFQVFYDYEEGEDPVHLYTETPVPRARLIAMYPDKEDEIAQLPRWYPEVIPGVEPVNSRGGDTVRVIEGCRIKMGRKDGKLLIMASDIELENAVWELEFHHLIPIKWSDDFDGLGGKSLARVIGPDHSWIQQMTQQIAQATTATRPRLFVHENSNVENVSTLNMEQVKWSGQIEPTIKVHETISPQLVELTEKRKRGCYVKGRVNPDAAAGTRPQGLNSAPAQREWVDIGSVNSRPQQKVWEGVWKRAARLFVALAAKAYKDKALRVRAPNTKKLQQVKWDGLLAKLKEEQYQITFALASGLSQTTSGKLEQLGILLDKQVIDTADFVRHLGLVDIESLSSRVNAPRELAEAMVSLALNKNDFRMPSALQGEEGLSAIVKIGSQRYQEAELNGTYPFPNMECLRKLIKAAQDRRPKPPAPVPAPPPPPTPVTIVPGDGAPPVAAPAVAA